ncbi:MAG: FAD-dependent oxidoreductase [Rhodobacteraceae bacterium]|nr:FAD-dependent oxidoreductase [Paracoccaceae bacterium]
MREFDYVIVGGGTSGCVVASRLSETDDISVLLVEAGPRDTNPDIHRPAGLFRLLNGGLTSNTSTVPQANLDGRELAFVQGRVLGGGSSVNGQVFTRGCPEDYDRWARDFGCTGWGFADVLPYFRRSERNDTLAGEFHGTDGPQGISTMSPDALTKVFVRACQQAGIPYTPDFNDGRQEGAGVFQTFTWQGRRCSTATAYLHPVASRRNLAVRTGCSAVRIVVEHGRATGIELVSGRRQETVRATREVIVAAGAIGSPRLLMLSGIGPADDLAAHGIDVIADLPAIGQNLQDHLDIDLILSVNRGLGLDRYKAPHRMLGAWLQYALFGTGPVTSTIVEGGAFWTVNRQSPGADIQVHFEPATGTEPGTPVSPTGAGCMFNGYFVRPRSRGSVRLASSDPESPPLIDPNYLAEPEDLKMTVEAVKLMRDIACQAAFTSVGASEIFPAGSAGSDQEIAAFIRSHGRTAYHPVGTCRMGGGADAAVDTALRVRGLDGLRVCDSSIMPSLISSNTNAAAIMIGERASDLILAAAD